MATQGSLSSPDVADSGCVIGAIATVHAPTIALTRPDKGDGAIYDGFEHLARWYSDLGPDLVILFSAEHIVNFQRSHVPSFLVGLGERHRIVREFDLPADKTIPGDTQTARELVEFCYGNGFDVSHSADLALDHGSVIPLHHLDPGFATPVVPIFFNTAFPPLPTLRRSYQLGQQVGEFVRRRLGGRRTLLLATGGIVHAVGERPRALDFGFDKTFVEAMVAGDVERILEMDQEQLDELGNGTNEIRCWLAMRGALGGDAKGEIVTAEPGGGPRMGMYQMKWEMAN